MARAAGVLGHRCRTDITIIKNVPLGFVLLVQGLSMWSYVFIPQGHRTMSGDALVCHSGEGPHLAGSGQGEPSMLPVQNCFPPPTPHPTKPRTIWSKSQQSEFEKPCCSLTVMPYDFYHSNWENIKPTSLGVGVRGLGAGGPEVTLDSLRVEEGEPCIPLGHLWSTAPPPPIKAPAPCLHPASFPPSASFP